MITEKKHKRKASQRWFRTEQKKINAEQLPSLDISLIHNGHLIIGLEKKNLKQLKMPDSVTGNLKHVTKIDSLVSVYNWRVII